MILFLIKYKYVYSFYLLYEKPCNVDVANKPLLLSLLLLSLLLLLLLFEQERYIGVDFCQSLCKKCPYSELFSSVFSRIRTEYGEIRSISLVSKFYLHMFSHF